jgi:myo-inositol catabolism protein IolS
VHYTTLGSSDLRVSTVALGCWPFAGGAVWGEQDDDVSVATAHAALDAGITLFDTAEGYEAGHSERVLGRALAGRRDKAVIATKVSPNHLSPAGIAEACEQSLRNLQTDYIDLYQIHWPNHDLPLSDSVEALEKLKREGKVLAIGVSNFGIQDLSEMLTLGECVTNQMPFNLLWRGIEDEVLPLCVENGVGILSYSTVAQGLLTGRYASADEVPDGLSRTRLFSNKRPMATHSDPGCEQEVFSALDRVRQVAGEMGVSMAAVSIAWVKQQPGVTAVLVGARTPQELEKNLADQDTILSQDVLAELTIATDPVKECLGGNLDMWMTPSRMR